jgi:hypothetical protein
MSPMRGLRLVRAARFLTQNAPKSRGSIPAAGRQRPSHLVGDRGDDDHDIVLVKLRVGPASASRRTIQAVIPHRISSVHRLSQPPDHFGSSGR